MTTQAPSSSLRSATLSSPSSPPRHSSGSSPALTSPVFSWLVAPYVSVRSPSAEHSEPVASASSSNSFSKVSCSASAVHFSASGSPSVS